MKWFRYGACLLFFLSLFFLPDPNEDYLFLQTICQNTESCIKTLLSGDEKFGTPAETALHLTDLKITGGGSESGPEDVEREIRFLVVLKSGVVYIGLDDKLWRNEKGQVLPDPEFDRSRLKRIVPFSLNAERTDQGGRVLFSAEGGRIQEERHTDAFRWYAILPPFMAILLALLFQKTLLALFFGVWLGATLLEGMNPLFGLWRFADHYLIEKALKDEFRMDIIGFVIGLCATVGVLTRGGGIQGLVNKMVGFARSVRSTQLVSYLMGLAIFFDDYANCIIVGNTTRPLMDRMKISREKLAYIVDSTAAPVAGLSMLSTWIAYEVSTFSAQLPEAGIQEGPYEIFFQTIPYRFYCILVLVFIATQILLQRDFGPMLKAERRARSTGAVLRPTGKPLVSAALTKLKAKDGAPARWYNAFFPIFFMILVTLEELWRIGGGWQRPLSDLLSGSAIREVLGAASDVNSARPIFIGSLAAFGLAVLLVMSQRILSFKECMKAALISTKALFFAIAILLLAWCIGGVCSDIGTAHFLIALFKGVIHPVLFPIILFLTACIVSFATGSSWSTMSILLPNTVIFAVKMGEMSDLGAMPMLVISIGAVLEGSIFGDHCSPISDTTILSSVSAASDHMDHIKTQAPYAICVMVVAILVGYLPAALGLHPGISLLAGLVCLFALLLLLGKRAVANGKK